MVIWNKNKREEAIKAFKSSKLEVLIATNVAARGTEDVNECNWMYLTIIYLLIVNHMFIELEELDELGKEGMAISIVTPHEL